MEKPYQIMPDIEALPAYFPIPGMGFLAVNAFLLQAAEPMLLDTGVAVLSKAFLEQFEKIIDFSDIKCLWMTHTDQDHIGTLQSILEAMLHSQEKNPSSGPEDESHSKQAIHCLCK